MLFYFISVVVPITLFLLFPAALKSSKYRSLLFAAGLVYAVSWYVPSPVIDGQQTECMTHLFGGGVFSGMFGLYLKLETGWRTKWYIELLALYALVSSLGVLNELFELVLYSQGLMPNGITDTSWDLAANTLGALMFFTGYKAGQATWRS